MFLLSTKWKVKKIIVGHNSLLQSNLLKPWIIEEDESMKKELKEEAVNKSILVSNFGIIKDIFVVAINDSLKVKKETAYRIKRNTKEEFN